MVGNDFDHPVCAFKGGFAMFLLMRSHPSPRGGESQPIPDLICLGNTPVSRWISQLHSKQPRRSDTTTFCAKPRRRMDYGNCLSPPPMGSCVAHVFLANPQTSGCKILRSCS